MIRLRDEDGWTMWAMALLMGAGLVVILAATVGLSWWLWPKDAAGNPLPCTHYHDQTTVVMAGKVPVIQTIQVCDTWASPTTGAR